MIHFGVGYCDSGYYAGWDGKGTESQEACNKLCLEESQCTYAAWWFETKEKATCSRYNGKTCSLTCNQPCTKPHVTYWKQSTGESANPPVAPSNPLPHPKGGVPPPVAPSNPRPRPPHPKW